MEPLSALSVASSTIQLLDFGSKLWGRVHELYVSANGTTATHQMLRTEAKRLRDLNAGLGQLLVPDNLRRSLTPTEQAVVALCSECDDAASELVSALEKLSIGDIDESSVRFCHKARVGESLLTCCCVTPRKEIVKTQQRESC
jgi:hypothetical protein